MEYREFKIDTSKFIGTDTEKQSYMTMLIATLPRFGFMVGFDYAGNIVIREEIEDTSFIEEILSE